VERLPKVIQGQNEKQGLSLLLGLQRLWCYISHVLDYLPI